MDTLTLAYRINRSISFRLSSIGVIHRVIYIERVGELESRNAV